MPELLGGRYELGDIVGRGRVVEVYRAYDTRLDRVVAVKTLREDMARDQRLQARFRREQQSVASLNNPSIVAVYDTGEDMLGSRSRPYIVMEYVRRPYPARPAQDPPQAAAGAGDGDYRRCAPGA